MTTSQSRIYRIVAEVRTAGPQPWWRRLAPPLAALSIACAALALLMQLARSADGPAATQLVLFGMVLVIGAFAGRCAEAIRLPRLTGYLLAGVALSPSLWGLLDLPDMFVPRDSLATLDPANDLAVGVIALMAGVEIEAGWLRQHLRRLLLIAGAETLLVPPLLLACLLLMPDVSFLRHESFGVGLVLMAALAAIMLLPNGPTVIITVIKETRASGPLTRMLMGTSVVLDACVILLFSIATTLLDLAAGGQLVGALFDVGALIRAAGAVIAGMGSSVVLGAAIGWGLRRYAEHTEHRLGWLVLGIALAVAALGVHAGIKPLFCLLTAGFAFGNLPSADPAQVESARQRLRQTLAHVGMPVFVVFFTAAGLHVDLLALASSWWVVLVLLLVRDGAIVAAVRLGTRVGARSAPVEPAVRRSLWIGMVSQAGITLALAQIVRVRYPGWGETLATLIVAMVTVHEIWVPVALSWALKREGEAAGSDDRVRNDERLRNEER